MKRPSVAQNAFIEIHRNIERAIDKNTGREAPVRVVFKGERQVAPGIRAQGSYGVGANIGVCFACDSQRDAVGVWTKPCRWRPSHCTPITFVKKTAKTDERRKGLSK